MYKVLCFIGFAFIINNVVGQYIIYPTYRPPPTRYPVIRTARSADDPRAEPKWLYQGDIPRAPTSDSHPSLPKYIDDVRFNPHQRYARSSDDERAQPKWLNEKQSSLPASEIYIDDVRQDPNRRHVRSDDERAQPQWLDEKQSSLPASEIYIDDVKIDPNTRYARNLDRATPQWLYQGDVPRAPASSDHPTLPRYIDDFKLDPNRRYARSLDSPSAKRGGGSHSTSSGNRDTGRTHPGYNRRNA